MPARAAAPSGAERRRSGREAVARGFDAASSWIQLASGQIPGGDRELRLLQRGDDVSIVLDEAELMTNRFRASERALATLACARLRERPNPRILIGGLGMGFTLRGALDVLGPEASVVVAELVPAVAEWARGPLAATFDGALDDPRVELRLEDVHRTVQSGQARFDAILLDVDNGPRGLTQRDNDRLYDIWGLRRARFALRPGGVLGVWSGGPDRRFKARLKRAGFEVEEVRVHANGRESGRRHVLWFARSPDE